jgi:hypothetical protein
MVGIDGQSRSVIPPTNDIQRREYLSYGRCDLWMPLCVLFDVWSFAPTQLLRELLGDLTQQFVCVGVPRHLCLGHYMSLPTFGSR